MEFAILEETSKSLWSKGKAASIMDPIGGIRGPRRRAPVSENRREFLPNFLPLPFPSEEHR
jgi:hypothetical protein